MLICLEHWIPKKCVCEWTFCGQLGNINLKYLLICELQKDVKGRIFPSGIPAYSEVESDQPSLVTNVKSQKGSAIERSTIHLSRSNESNGRERRIRERWLVRHHPAVQWKTHVGTFDTSESYLPFASHTLHLLVGMEHLQTKGTPQKCRVFPHPIVGVRASDMTRFAPFNVQSLPPATGM